MPRTFTGAQRTAASGAQLACFGKLEVTDPDGTWRDVASLNSVDWFNSAEISDNIDANTISFSAVVLRDTGNLSLSPYMSASLVNRNGVGAFAPMLDNHRYWRVSSAVLAFGATPVAGDWKELGKGILDVIDIQDATSTITLSGRGMEADLLDGFISRVKSYGNNATPVAMETVLQSMLDDQLGTGLVSLYTPVSPSFVMRNWAQQQGNLMGALTAVAEKAGFILRYKYDASDVLRFTLIKPNRTPSGADWTIGASEYLALPSAKTDLAGVRNYIEVTYLDATLGKQIVTSPALSAATVTATAGAATFSTSQAGIIQNGSVIVVNRVAYTVSAFNGTTGCTLSGTPTFGATAFATSASLSRYGLRYMAVDLAGDSQVTSNTQAQGMADAMRSDLELPALEQTFETFGFWFVQLGDYGTLLANGVHSDSDQSGGVISYRHRFANGTLRTTVGLRGKPAGRYRTYLNLGAYKQAAPPQPVAPIPTLTLGQADVSDESATVHLDLTVGTTPAAALTYTLTAKPGRGGPVSLSSGACSLFPLDVSCPQHPRYTTLLTLTVVDPVTGSVVKTLTVSPVGKDGANNTGTGTTRQNEDETRSGGGGYPTPGNAYKTQPQYDMTGTLPLIDPTARKIMKDLYIDTGVRGAADVAFGNTVKFAPNRHTEQKTGKDTDSLVFGVTFDLNPKLTVLPVKATAPTGGNVFEWGGTNNVSGTTLRCVQTSGGTPTGRTDSFASSLNGTPAGGILLQNNGAAAFCNLVNADGAANPYQVNFDVDTTSMDPSNTCYVQVYTNRGTADNTNWDLVGSASYGSGISATGQYIAFTSPSSGVSVINANYDIRVVVSYLTTPTAPKRASITCNTVTYTTISGGTTTSLANFTGAQVQATATEAA